MNKYQKTYNLQNTEDINYGQGLKLILRHTKPFALPFLLVSVVLLGASVIGNSLLPLLLKRAIDVNITNHDINGLTQTTLFFIGLVVIYVILSYIRLLFTGKLGQKILFNIRKEVFEKIQTLPSQFFSDNQSGDIIQRLTGNVDALNSFLSEGVIRFLDIFFSLIIILISIFYQSTIIGLIAVGGTILMIIYIILQGKIMEKPLAESLKQEGDMSANVQESLDGFIAIQSTNQQKSWIKKFEKKSGSYFSIMKRVSFLAAVSKAVVTALNILLVASLLLVLLNLYKTGSVTIGAVILVLSYAQNLIQEVSGISDIWKNIKTGIAASDRLNNVLSLQTDIQNIEKPFKPETVHGDVEFVDVDFSYIKDEIVLSDINFKVKAGEKVAIVGPTGAGKTTFVNLITRLYDADNGSIYIDGEDIKNWDLDTLRRNLGYLIQDTFLFEDTILNNLRYNNPKVTQEDAVRIFKELGASSFIKSLPKGLETEVSSEGNEISAGQRQLIALARILLRNPKILILDEATARVDTQSEKMLQKAIDKAADGKTTFIIAHRLSTIFNADKIILISNNTILEQGTHKELLEQKGFYYDMYSKFVGK
jgi:ATP-binding cassette subfamily B protein